jgi:hypothetical protein
LPRKKRLLRGCLVTLVVLAAGVVAGIVALMPGEGPPMLAALAPDADAIALARDAGALWGRLEGSERFARFRNGPAWRALVESPPGRAAAGALEKSRDSGLEITASRAAHLVGREAGAAVWLSPDGRTVRSWVAAFRIDTYARGAELAGRLAMGDRVSSEVEHGEHLRSLGTGGGAAVHWCRMGDLLVAAGDAAALRRAVRNCVLTVGRTDGTSRAPEAAAEVWASRPEDRFEVEPPAGGRGFWFAAKARPAPLLAAFPPGARVAEKVLRSAGIAPPLGEATVSLRLEGSVLVEDDFLRASHRAGQSVPGGTGGARAHGARPGGTYLYCSLRPDREEAAEQLRRELRGVLPAKGASGEAALTEMDIFVNLLLPRVWDEVVIATAPQEVDVANGGFPAEFSFFRVTGAGALVPALERALRVRSLGVFGPRDPLPTTYPYLVKRRSGDVSVYEITILYTRRHEGYRPALAVRGDEIIFCTSLRALERFLDEGGTPPPPRDAWLSPGGTEILRLDWRTPTDLRQLKNSYDYFIELGRYKERSAARLLSDTTDYAALWLAIESVLREVRSHERAAVAGPGGVRMRARWHFSD